MKKISKNGRYENALPGVRAARRKYGVVTSQISDSVVVNTSHLFLKTRKINPRARIKSVLLAYITAR